MKDQSFEAKIVAASPRGDKTNSFVKETMKQIKRAQPKQPKGFAHWFTHLHKPAMALAAFVAIVIVGGAAYAAVHFAPAFIQLLNKETNQRGATEFSVNGFADCSSNDYGPALKRIEVKKDVKVSDEDVQKILQAKCELAWIEQFARTTWPTYGTNAEWKDGDAIYYGRVDVLGALKQVNEQGATIDAHGSSIDYKTVEGETLKAYLGGSEIALSDLKEGDAVFSIVRATETYIDHSKFGWDKNSGTMYAAPNSNAHAIGLLALFKMSLPDKFYGEMQGYITEIPDCLGNEGELCANTPSIDVYPRVGGEGAMNPYFKPGPDSIHREISGTVTELTGDTLTLKSRLGNIYTVQVGDDGFTVYNRDFTAAYTTVDAHLKVGSSVAVRYNQPKDVDAKKITKEQVRTVVLQLEGLNPKKDLKQY